METNITLFGGEELEIHNETLVIRENGNRTTLYIPELKTLEKVIDCLELIAMSQRPPVYHCWECGEVLNTEKEIINFKHKECEK